MASRGAAGPDSRGVLYPAALPAFHRLPAPVTVTALVRWFWIPEWRIAPGRSVRQDVIAYPACNLVVEGASAATGSVAAAVGLAGPTTRRSFRDLTGTGWAVGALLTPAAVPHFTADPAALRDAFAGLDLPELGRAVAEAMAGGRKAAEHDEPQTSPIGGHGKTPVDDDPQPDRLSETGGSKAIMDDEPQPAPSMAPAGERSGAAPLTSDDDGDRRREQAVSAFAAWLEANVPAPSEAALLANALSELINGDPEIRTPGDAAARLGVSVRTAQRLASAYIGVSPAAMIRRRRLQEAAQRLRDEPGTDLAHVAADLGYADHAHLTRDFREVLGFTPSTYRVRTAPADPAHAP